MSKQSSIDWLVDQLPIRMQNYLMEEIEKARQMHKEETKDAFFGGIKSTGEGWNGEYANGKNPNVETVFKRDYEQYYNKTYERKTT